MLKIHIQSTLQQKISISKFIENVTKQNIARPLNRMTKRPNDLIWDAFSWSSVKKVKKLVFIFSPFLRLFTCFSLLPQKILWKRSKDHCDYLWLKHCEYFWLLHNCFAKVDSVSTFFPQWQLLDVQVVFHTKLHWFWGHD